MSLRTIHASRNDGGVFKLDIGDTVEIFGQLDSPRLIYLGTSGEGLNPDLKFREMSNRGRFFICSKQQAASLLSFVKGACCETHCLSSGKEGRCRRVWLRSDIGDLFKYVQVMDPCMILPGTNGTSTLVHHQVSGTCYAHACATVIHAAESRIIGRNPESPLHLADQIIKIFGTDGGFPDKVFNIWCPLKNLRFKRIQSATKALHAVREGRPVLASFYLTNDQWGLFSYFYEMFPEDLLTDSFFDDYEGKGTFLCKLYARNIYEKHSQLFASNNTSKVQGHAVVITGGSAKSNGTIEFRIKNSWGDDFANKGFFRVEANAFPAGFAAFYDVVFVVDDLTSQDLQNYNRHKNHKRKALPSINDYTNGRNVSPHLLLPTASDTERLEKVIDRPKPSFGILRRAVVMFAEYACEGIDFITIRKRRSRTDDML